MRQRITYLLPPGSGVDPADIKVDNSNVLKLGEDLLSYAKSSESAEERRITIGLSELPQEVFQDTSSR
jgi:hypothetical protein